jgi:hypothetical protein
VVVVAEKVQQPVEREHAKLGLKRVAGFTRLPLRHSCRNHNVAEELIGICDGRSRSERKHIGCTVTTAELAIERAHPHVAYERDGDVTHRPAWCHPFQPT